MRPLTRLFPTRQRADQWFTESQFESYRSLGFEITDQILRTKDIAISPPGQPKKMLQQLLAELPETTWAASPAGSPTRDA